jgi:hypothetical protein
MTLTQLPVFDSPILQQIKELWLDDQPTKEVVFYIITTDKMMTGKNVSWENIYIYSGKCIIKCFK